MRTISFAVCMSLLTGCAGQLDLIAQQVDHDTAAELARTVPTLQQTPPNATILGPISATSCLRGVMDAPATTDNAVAQLRLKARAQGGNAIGNLTCLAPEGVSFSKNCWQSVSCTGAALRLR